VGFSGARLAATRLKAGLTQEQLARSVGVDQARVSDWERGATTPRPEVIPEIAAALSLSALELLVQDPDAAALEDLRLAAGRSPQSLATELGISRRRYRALETGATRRWPSDSLIESLAEALTVPASAVRRGISAGREKPAAP
jgi:transcriptional regulator with XRE-family HTH domain